MENSASSKPPNHCVPQSATPLPKNAADTAEAANETLQTFIMGANPLIEANQTDSVLDSPLPAAFGRYEVRRTLGAGSFGTVYLGHDAQLDRQVAIKVLRLGSDVPRSEAERLLSEARKLARLHHPGIVMVHDVGTQDGQLFIVSNFLDGHDLAQWLSHNSPHWRESATIVAAVCDALAHAHAHVTIHRDVKPANIILTSGLAPVLVDFGLALDESSAGGRELGIVAGTPAYMAPEQIAGTAHRIDGRTDIYSLGVVLYEMLCRRLPFRASETGELLRQIRDDEPQPPRQLAPDIPNDLQTICLRALSKKMHDRYATAADFALDLRRVVQTVSESAPTSSVLDSTFGESMQGPPGSSMQLGSRWSSPSSTSVRNRVREAERRQITVLVCGSQLFESDRYLEIDAEDQAQILQAFHQQCTQTIGRFEGTVVQCDERGLLACFGYPVGYEGAARRAARSGLGMLDDMKELADRLELDYQLQLQPWVGIHTGTAIVESNQQTVSLVGEARNVALRLETVAEAGQVICTEETFRLFKGRFQCSSLGSQKIKGVSHEVQLFRVEGVAWTGNLIETSLSTDLSPLTGRDHETSVLNDRWEKAQEGMGQVVCLAGEAGLGKSRLVSALKSQVLEQIGEGEVDVPVIEFRCAPRFQNTGLYPAIDFFERTLDFNREELGPARFDRLVQYLEQYDLAKPEAVPLWASLLSLPTADLLSPLVLPPARQREETFRILLEWLQARAARRPVLFIIEDLHWMDASTLEFLDQFLADCIHDPILTVLTFRPDFKAPWPAGAHLSSLALNRLTRRQSTDLMRMNFGRTLSETLIEQIYDRTGGVPFFIEEFTKMVQQSITAPPTEGDATAVNVNLAGHEIPATLQDLMTTRLDRMEGEREVAQLAATIGREFSHEVLAAVSAMDDVDLNIDLGRLVQADILYQKGRPPRSTYLFKHALLEDALYNSLIKNKRQELHRRVAEALEVKFPETAECRPEVLAHHFTEAGMSDKAIEYWLRAGVRSKDKSADVEAISHLTKGLALLNATKQTPRRDEQELQFVTTLAPAYIAVRGYAAPEVGPILMRARELCRRIGDPQQSFGILLGMWEWRLVRGELQQAVELAAEGVRFAESQSDDGMLMEALFMQGATLFYRGQFEQARACHERALANYDDRVRTKFWTGYSGHNAGVTHRCYLALSLWHLGYPDRAVKMVDEAQELARSIRHAYSLAHAIDFSAYLQCYCRQGIQVQASAEEEIKIGIDQSFELWQALGTLHKGAGMFFQGRQEEALPLLLKGYDAFRTTGAGVRIPSYLGMLAEIYIQSAKLEDARRVLSEGLSIAESNDDRCHEAELQRLKGELVLAESPDEMHAAETWFLQAIDTARLQNSKAWELRATISLALLWKRQGRQQEAFERLSKVYETYTEGLSTPDLVSVSALFESSRSA